VQHLYWGHAGPERPKVAERPRRGRFIFCLICPTRDCKTSVFVAVSSCGERHQRVLRDDREVLPARRHCLRRQFWHWCVRVGSAAAWATICRRGERP
jgi:hypothetical protein